MEAAFPQTIRRETINSQKPKVEWHTSYKALKFLRLLYLKMRQKKPQPVSWGSIKIYKTFFMLLQRFLLLQPSLCRRLPLPQDRGQQIQLSPLAPYHRNETQPAIL